jgi:hypothetical protein
MTTPPAYLANYCLDLSGFLYLSQSQKLQYQQAWNVFNKVQLYNIHISTLRNDGDTTLTYYQFPTNQEMTYFIKGQSLHTFSYPSTNWLKVPDN